MVSDEAVVPHVGFRKMSIERLSPTRILRHSGSNIVVVIITQ